MPLCVSLQGQVAFKASSPSPPPPPPPPPDPSIQMLASSSFGTATSPPPLAQPGERRPSTKAPHPSQVLKCPRCGSLDTKFCYYNNYSLSQPRYFCKNCKRYWTAGGALRNVPVGGGLRKNKRSKLKLAAADADAFAAAQALAVQQQNQVESPANAETLKNNHAPSIGSSASTASPGGTSTNLARMEPQLYTFDSSGRVHSSRISSGADHGGTATLDYGGSTATEHGAAANAAAAASGHHPGSNFYGEGRQLPQFYSSYSTSLPALNQYNTEAPSYVVNYNLLPSSNGSNLLPNEAAGPSPSSNNQNGEANPTISGKSLSSNGIKQEVDEAAASNPYDWQLISEGLFNGAGDGFLYLPGESWPAFSQFNDPGPG